MIDTFSVHSLELIEKSISDLNFIKKDKSAEIGNIYHALISYFLKNYNIQKFENTLQSDEKKNFNDLKNSKFMEFILTSENKWIEAPFFVKSNLDNKPFYLTGRFDLIIKNNNKFTIIDWKTKNLPKNPKYDIQTMVYIYALSKMKNTNNIDMIYYSIENKITANANFSADYELKIKELIKKAI